MPWATPITRRTGSHILRFPAEPAAENCLSIGSKEGISAVRIAIDIRQMSDYGVATYTRNVVRNLARMDHVNEYFLIGMVERLKKSGELPPNFHCVPFEGHDE